MRERYQRLYTLQQNLYADGAPLLVAAGALLWDTQLNRMLVQLKLKCLSPKGLRGVRVQVQPRDLAERPLGEPIEYSYMDLNTAYGSEFGTKNPILLPDPMTRCFSVTVREAVYGDRSIWQGEGSWEPLPPAEPLEQTLGEELAREYRLQYGWDSVVTPRHLSGLWQCTCGALFTDDQELCPRCGRPGRELNREELIRARDVRLEEARKAVEEEARQQAEAARLAAEQTAREEEERARLAAQWQAQQEAEAARQAAEEEAERLRIQAQWQAQQAQQQAQQAQQPEQQVQQPEQQVQQPEQQVQLPAAAEPEKPKKKKKLWIIPVVLLILAGLAAAAWFYGLPMLRYYQAEKLAEEGKTTEAAQAFAALGDFRDAKERSEALVSDQQAEKQEENSADDESTQTQENSAEQTAETTSEEFETTPLAQCKAGDYVSFGVFEQDGDRSNGMESITWIVLRRQGNKVLLLSKDCLDICAFQSEKGEITWEKSSLRAWLNDSFYNTAFASAPYGSAQNVDLRTAILSTIISSPVGGSARTTHDKVFLLTYDNVELYLVDKLDGQGLIANASPALGQSDPVAWWLCAPLQAERNGNLVPIVPTTGEGYEYVGGAAFYGVRPAIWVDLSELG